MTGMRSRCDRGGERTGRPASRVSLTLFLALSLGGAGPAEPPGVRQESIVDEPVLRAVPVQGASPRIDGRLAEDAWTRAEPVNGFIQFEPDAGAPSASDTEVRVLYSRDAIYIGVRLFDSSPERIRAPLARRDEAVDSDWFYVFLDSSGDEVSAVAFGVNPRGVKRDFRIDRDGRENSDWKAVWDAAVSMDHQGWVVEMRIPLSQLPPGWGGRGAGDSWRGNFERHHARTGEVSSWAPIPRNRRLMVASFGRMEGMEQLRAPLRAEFLPYAMARVRQRGPAEEPDPLFGTVGADLRVGVGSGMTLSATFNPDFGQVEADPAVVNVTGYRTFFPEKRPFFLEDRGLFEMSIGTTRIFHSRRIGRDSEVAPGIRSGLRNVPDASGILAAGKLSGRTAGGWSIGLLHALTNAAVRVTEDSLGVETVEPLEPRTNHLVARLVREKEDGSGAVGGIFTGTHRLMSEGLDLQPSEAWVGGVDGWRELGGGAYRVSAAVFGSHVSGQPRAIDLIQRAHGRYLQRPDAAHLDYDPNRTSLTGFVATASLARTGPGNWIWGAGGQAISPAFEVNDLGYQRSADEARQFAYLGYDRLARGFLLRRRTLLLNQWGEWTFGGERTGVGGSAELRLQFLNFWGLIGIAERQLAGLSTDLLRGGPAVNTPASSRIRAVLYTDPRRNLSLRLDGSETVEDETGGRLRVLRGSVALRPAGIAALTLEPSLVVRDGLVDYLATREVDGLPRSLFGASDHRTLSLVTRLDLAFSPTLTLQFHAQPYLTSRGIDGYLLMEDPRAGEHTGRFRSLHPSQVEYDEADDRIRVDLEGDGAVDLLLPSPQFHYGQLSSNVVLRWEFRPGSTVFFVWSRQGQERRPGVLGDLPGGAMELVGLGSHPVPASHSLLVKASLWFSP